MMKPFLLRLLLFGVLLWASAFGLDCLVTTGLRNVPTGEYKVWNDIVAGKAASDIFIYGSSRAWVQVNPKIIEDSLGMSCYNFGMDGHNFRMQYARHQLLWRYNPKPRLIVLILDYRTLDKRPDLYHEAQFLPYFDEEPIRQVISEYKGFQPLDFYLPLVRYTGYRKEMRLSMENLLDQPQKRPDRYRGYAGQDRAWTGEFEKAKRERGCYYQPLDNTSVALFDRFLSETKTTGVELVMVYPPEFIEGQQFVANREEIFSLYRQFANQYGIPLLDYSGDPLSFRKELFYNTQHLNQRGAELFTTSLVQKLQHMKLVNRPAPKN
jgi:hypothetical protein